MVDQSIVTSVKKYLSQVGNEGINAPKAVIFGSAARGDMRKDSDIDLIVLSPSFDKPYTRIDTKKLWRATIVDYRIEPIPCGCKEWETDDSRPILEIARREGIMIEA